MGVPPIVGVATGQTTVLAGLASILIAWGLGISLQDILTYPDRVSVLPNLQTDALTYYGIAVQLASDWSLDALPPRHPPGWVSMLAALYTFTGPSYVAGKLISWAALGTSVVLCAILARRVYCSAAGWIAALLCATAPAMRGYVGTLQYEIVTALLLLALVLLAERATRVRATRPLRTAAALTGLAAGALILTRETFLVIVPLIGIWMAFRVRPRFEWRSALIAAGVFGVIAVTPAVIWSAIQSVRHQALITISEKGPMVIAFGNNPLANGTYNAPLVGVGEPAGLEYVRQAPGRALLLAGRKALYFWGILRDGWNVPRPAAVWAWRASTGLLPFGATTAVARGGWLLALFLFSLWWLGREGWRTWWLLPAIVGTLMAVHMVTLSSHRFAVPMLPIVFVLVSGPLLAGGRVVLSAVRAPSVAVGSAVVVMIIIAMQFQSWPLAQTYRAVDLDGIAADNRVDAVSGQRARFAAAGRGARPVLLLPDEYMPSGVVTVEVTMRLTGAAGGAGPVARATLVELNGRVACVQDVAVSGLSTDRFTPVAVPCVLSRDTPATLAVHSLGTADFAIHAVRFAWAP